MKDNAFKQLYDLPLSFNGITLNNQDIDLMLIASANNFIELEDALSKITNIKISLNFNELSEDKFLDIRQQIYDMYLDNLTSKIDYIKNNNIETLKKIEYLKSSGYLSKKEITIIDNIFATSKTKKEILKRIIESFSQDKVHRMNEIIRDFSPIERSGIKSTSLEASRNLLEEIKNNYNSITIDSEAKYGKIVLHDGSFIFKHLQKSLDFAKKYNKQVRLNTLVFYMDCPDELYNLEKTPENKIIVKQKLESYIENITKFLLENGYTDTVRSIDVFNELLNRFSLSNESSYMYRGDIPQTSIVQKGNPIVDDNIKSGWLKHLDIEDLCDVIKVARKNMPTTDFMYNDDNLIDSKKIEPTIKLIKQIRENEKRLGVKLINSIGTQMHIDNSVTKDQIKEMIINLSQFGLPIEITEFDIVITKGIENLREEQIETLRQEKINEIYECVEELREKCNIRGFTIWSKTDKQNFRVSLANEERIAKTLEPIDTLHGGYYNDIMKTRKSIFQSFNYHTHTHRCGHAKESDKAYVEAAKKVGITQLGFSDHIPVTELEYQNPKQQMHISDIDEYIESIHKLQQENPNMKILCGFESEFDPRKTLFLSELKDKVDYMILGQHFIPEGMGETNRENNPEYPLKYAEMVCSAMKSGIYDIVAHPDIFMQYRDSLDSEENNEIFIQNAIKASKMICETAKELNIPLELNFEGMEKKEKDGSLRKYKDGEFAYPHSLFWEIAIETEVLVLYGVDAHTPEHFIKMEQSKQRVDTIIDTSKLNLVDNNYNPVEARKNNKKLQDLFEKTKKESLTYETHLITQIISGIIDNIPDDEFTPEKFSYMSKATLENLSNDFYKKLSIEDKSIELIIETISNEPALLSTERINNLNKYKTLLEQQTSLKLALDTINISIEMGCKSKEDFKSIITQIIESKTTKSIERRNEILKKLQSYSPEEQDLTTFNKGFISLITLSLIIPLASITAILFVYILSIIE